MNLNLPTLNELIEKYRKDAIQEARASIKNAREHAQERIKKAETNRQALALLDGAGVEISCFGPGYAYVSLGFFPNTPGGNRKLAEAVRHIRDVLGCRLHLDSKEVDSAKKKTVLFTLKPVEFPTIRVQFSRKLPKDAKCKIVRQHSVYSQLVCEA
jgi:hypothetical protein